MAHYLEGAPHPVTIYSDHQNPQYYKKPQDLSHWQAHWMLYLSCFDFVLVHLPGPQMIQSDTLSRRADHCRTVNNNTQLTMLPPSLFICFLNLDLQHRLHRATAADPLITNTLAAVQRGGPPPMHSALTDWRVTDGLVFFKDCAYVLPDLALHREILCHHHDLPVGSHPSHLKTLELVRRIIGGLAWPPLHVPMLMAVLCVNSLRLTPIPLVLVLRLSRLPRAPVLSPQSRLILSPACRLFAALIPSWSWSTIILRRGQFWLPAPHVLMHSERPAFSMTVSINNLAYGTV